MTDRCWSVITMYAKAGMVVSVITAASALFSLTAQEYDMATVKVTPMIGTVTNDRLDSLRGCHALPERAVVKGCTAATVGQAVTEAIQEIILNEAAGGRKYLSAEEFKFVVQFKV